VPDNTENRTEETSEKSIARRPDPFDWWPSFMPRRFLDWFDAGDLFEGEHRMRVEECTEGDELVIRAEMPGIDPEKDVQVHLRNHRLEIRAERKQQETSKEKGVRRSEFHYGSFSRVVTLPPDATESDVHASYKDGILEVRVPRDRKQADATKVPVERRE
jgi:HSP20 family protein